MCLIHVLQISKIVCYDIECKSKQIRNVMSAIEQIFPRGERWHVLFNEAKPS